MLLQIGPVLALVISFLHDPDHVDTAPSAAYCNKFSGKYE
jgi:hypothetical protein